MIEVNLTSGCNMLLLPYAEDKETPTKTVYGFVPVEIVEQVIRNHGLF